MIRFSLKISFVYVPVRFTRINLQRIGFLFSINFKCLYYSLDFVVSPLSYPKTMV